MKGAHELLSALDAVPKATLAAVQQMKNSGNGEELQERGKDLAHLRRFL